MNLFREVLDRAERWIEAIDVERDRLASTTAWALISPVECAFIRARLAQLEKERLQTLETLATLRTLEYRPEVMFADRPKRMLKVPLRKPRQEKSA